jgi:hypothetical protein
VISRGRIRVTGDSLCRAGYGYGTFIFFFFFSPCLLRFLLLVRFSQLLRITIPQRSGCAKEKGGGGGGSGIGSRAEGEDTGTVLVRKGKGRRKQDVFITEADLGLCGTCWW